MKKHKMLYELVNNKETEMGGIDIKTAVGIMNDISKVAKKYGFTAYSKGYPKEVLDYKPTGNTYKIATIKDIVNLTPDQFEFFIEDLRQYCNYTRGIQELGKIGDELGFRVEQKDYMTRLDTGLNEAIVKAELNITNKI